MIHNWQGVHQPDLMGAWSTTGETTQSNLDPNWAGGVVLVICLMMLAGMCWLVFRD